MARDGRLSAEELDALLDASGSPPAEPQGSEDELHHGRADDEPRPWGDLLSRHRTACAVLAVAAAAIGIAAWWHAAARRVADLDIAATVVVQRVDGGDGDLITTTLALTPSTADDSLRAIALQGQGLTMPAVTQDGGTVRAVNLASCGEVSGLDQPAEYTLRVTRADGSGAEASRDLPIAGDGDRRVWAAIVDECVDDATESMALRYFAASRRGPAFLRAGILNTSVWDLYLYGAVASVRPRRASPADQGLAYFTTQGGPVLLPAGDVTQVGLVPQVDGCRRWRGGAVWTAQVAAGQPGRPGDLTVFVGPARVPPGTTRVAGRPFDLYPAQRAAVVEALLAPCGAGTGQGGAIPLID